MTAVALARRLDGEMADTAYPQCAGQLRETLDRIRELAPKGEGDDAVDDLAARRAERLAAG